MNKELHDQFFCTPDYEMFLRNGEVRVALCTAHKQAYRRYRAIEIITKNTHKALQLKDIGDGLWTADGKKVRRSSLAVKTGRGAVVNTNFSLVLSTVDGSVRPVTGFDKCVADYATGEWRFVTDGLNEECLPYNSVWQCKKPVSRKKVNELRADLEGWLAPITTVIKMHGYEVADAQFSPRRLGLWPYTLSEYLRDISSFREPDARGLAARFLLLNEKQPRYWVYDENRRIDQVPIPLQVLEKCFPIREYETHEKLYLRDPTNK